MQSVKEILSELENADNTTKNQIENELVSIGESVVPWLINYKLLEVSKEVLLQ